MTNSIDKILFQDLSSCDPGEVTKRTGALYDEKKGSYRVSIWGNSYDVLPQQCRIKSRGQVPGAYRDYWYLFMLHYLMGAKEIPVSGQWISEKDIPGGMGFFRGPIPYPHSLWPRRLGMTFPVFWVSAKGLAVNPFPWPMLPFLSRSPHGFQ